MDYQIVATLGPASMDPQLWQQMISAGVTVFRYNTSHGGLPQIDDFVDRFRAFNRRLKRPVPLVLDLQGSKWRLGTFTAFELLPGDKIELVYTHVTSHPATLPVPHRDFFRAASSSSKEVTLNDAKITLQVKSIEHERLIARVKTGGHIEPRKGITFRASDFRNEVLSEKDQTLVERHIDSFISFAISYVKDHEEMKHYRALIGSDRYLIGKLERQPAIDDTKQIAKFCNELWLCRGDLGAELGLITMAETVHVFSRGIAKLSRPVMMAGQVLEHMTQHPGTTRSEMCHLYDLLQIGYHGIVLSDETAIGKFPVQACKFAAMFRSIK